jgi:hypothetical protein
MLLASALVSDLEFLVDDENSERYSFANDYMPALNMAVRYIMSAFDKAFERGVLAPSIFNELLTAVLVSPTAIPNEDAVKLALTSVFIVQEKLWRIVGVDPDPVISGTTDYVTAGARLAKFIPLINSGGATEDPFAPGYAGLASDLDLFTYTQINTIDPDGGAAQYLVVRPAPTNTKVGIIHLRTPTKISAVDSEVEFPPVLHQPVVMKAYQYLMIQAGREASTALQVSDKDVKELTALFM